MFFLLFCRSHAFFIRCITPNPKKVGRYPDLLRESLNLKTSPLQQLSFHSWGLDFLVSFDSLKLFFPFSLSHPSLWPCELTIHWGIRSLRQLDTKGCIGFCVPSPVEHGKI